MIGGDDNNICLLKNKSTMSYNTLVLSIPKGPHS